LDATEIQVSCQYDTRLARRAAACRKFPRLRARRCLIKPQMPDPVAHGATGAFTGLRLITAPLDAIPRPP